MSDQKFTPGPWNYTDGAVWGVQPDQYGDPEQFKIAECSPDDAPLIAAAPDMYKALVDIASYLGNKPLRSDNEDLIIYRCSVPISKAEGRIP